eukprot:TRINITY_DN3512_c0_g2_i1.p1 TRINITY_DN3512_c0_g2~~TRINITY_DN3512_c0_g2_i1.p1  ORF type:complete len:405 (+),score=35.81 TRINITY_DN3512_c0_g2_i1:62-1276(+)
MVLRPTHPAMRAVVLAELSAAAVGTTNASDACRSAIFKRCVYPYTSSVICQNCVAEHKDELLAAGCTGKQLSTVGGPFCRCQCTADCFGALQERCAAPANMSGIQRCIGCVAKGYNYLLGVPQCRENDLAGYCILPADSGGPPQPMPQPSPSGGNACLKQLYGSCAHLDQPACDGCLVVMASSINNYCSRQQQDAFCQCQCTPACSTALNAHCPITWSHDAPDMVQRCVACVLDNAARVSLAAAGCSDAMLVAYCQRVNTLPPPPSHSPTAGNHPAPHQPCFEQMMGLCGTTGFGPSSNASGPCLHCLTLERQQLIKPTGQCSEEDFLTIAGPFCQCHGWEFCTPAPPAPVDPRHLVCDVCPGTDWAICCQRGEKCYDYSTKPYKVTECCDCGADRCDCRNIPK